MLLQKCLKVLAIASLSVPGGMVAKSERSVVKAVPRTLVPDNMFRFRTWLVDHRFLKMPFKGKFPFVIVRNVFVIQPLVRGIVALLFRLAVVSSRISYRQTSACL